MNKQNSAAKAHTYKRKLGFEVVSVPDGYVVYDDARGMVHYLNPTAAMVLELCDICATETAIAQRIQAMFELAKSPESDVDTCLAQLLSQGLIVRN